MCGVSLYTTDPADVRSFVRSMLTEQTKLDNERTNKRTNERRNCAIRCDFWLLRCRRCSVCVVVRCSLFVVRCSLFVVRRSLMDVAVTTHNLLVCHVREGGNSVHVTVRACRGWCVDGRVVAHPTPSLHSQAASFAWTAPRRCTDFENAAAHEQVHITTVAEFTIARPGNCCRLWHSSLKTYFPSSTLAAEFLAH